ncbi:YqiJ family protein [Aurantiacibacter sediminis]|uniref:YqiJ family protein n=1 Tax=Aurantiacibacter sediminis TaxID=2793064 RepID=A0ABS0N4I7_9SPHN|nr:YqiJ family protein [Aurantiacibacter sediminis]MBH5322271.1 YqiJ family protein [Aurantiacibacter sediminis]
MSLFADYNLPFAIALGVMALLTLLQVIGLGDFDFGGDVDLDVGADGEIADPTSAGLGGAITTLLGLGKVPLFVWLIVYLLLFAVIGMSIQAFASDLTGTPLFAWLAALIAGGASLPVTATLVRPLGRLLPQDETSAVSLNTLVGKRAVITDGTSEKGSAARARVRDHHGQTHYVMVEPHEDASVIPAGDEVLLVRREGNVFFGVPLAERKLAPMGN